MPLLSVFPNPVRGPVTIRYSLPEPQRFSLKLYDVTGRMARTLASGLAKAGDYSVKLDTRTIARGVYVLRCDIGGRVLTRKLAIE